MSDIVSDSDYYIIVWGQCRHAVDGFALPPHLSSGRHPDHHQPAAKVPAAVRASSEEIPAKRHVLLPQAQQDSFHLDTTGLLLLFLLLEFRVSSGEKPVPLEGLAETRERGTVRQIRDIEWSFHNIVWRKEAFKTQQSYYEQRLVNVKHFT